MASVDEKNLGQTGVARPDIIADVDEFGARLIIRQGESLTIARPSPQGALDLAAWLKAWALGQSSATA